MTTPRDEAESHMSKGRVIPERGGLIQRAINAEEPVQYTPVPAPSDHLMLCEILTRAQVHIVAERDRITVEDEPGWATVFEFAEDGTLTKLSHACPEQTTPRANFEAGFRRGLEIAAEIARASTFQDGPEGTIEGQIARAILLVVATPMEG